MAYTVAIIDRKQLADTQIGILIRCNNDPQSDTWYTYNVTGSTVPSDLTAWANASKAAVLAQYTALNSLISTLQSLT